MMASLPNKLSRRLSTTRKRQAINRAVSRLIAQVHAAQSSGMPQPSRNPGSVAFFNASTRITGISLNAAFSLLTSLGLQTAGVPVVRFTCRSGMGLCVLGTNRDDPSQPPPCKACIAQSRILSGDAPTTWFSYSPEQALERHLRELALEELQEVEVPISFVTSTPASSIPLGRLVLPSVRWVLRRHHLPNDESTRFVYRQYILSAYNVATKFSAFLDRENPSAVVLFNGQFFPEATARWVCLERGVPVVTHEVGLQPFSAFFTTGEATAYPLHIPDNFELTPEQDERLDEYLSKRFQGQFSMAGIRFWSDMKGLGESFLQRLSAYTQVVPIFTNVIFDTSQPHSNVLFTEMFAWLDLVLETIRVHPETLFVLRAHPDESRPGKASRESVSQWVQQNGIAALPNMVFIDSNQTLSSYELIQRSKFVMVYNSTIGLEASILEVPVLCAGRARYTQLPTVFFPATQHKYQQLLEHFLATDSISFPAEFKRNARRFLYYQLFRSSLPFGDYLEEDQIWNGFVKLKEFPPQALAPSVSPAINAIYKGLFQGGDFLLETLQ